MSFLSLFFFFGSRAMIFNGVEYPDLYTARWAVLLSSYSMFNSIIYHPTNELYQSLNFKPDFFVRYSSLFNLNLFVGEERPSIERVNYNREVSKELVDSIWFMWGRFDSSLYGLKVHRGEVDIPKVLKSIPFFLHIERAIHTARDWNFTVAPRKIGDSL